MKEGVKMAKEYRILLKHSDMRWVIYRSKKYTAKEIKNLKAVDVIVLSQREYKPL